MTKTRKSSALPMVDAIAATDRVVTINAQGQIQAAPTSKKIQTVSYRSLRGSKACWRRFAIMDGLKAAMFITEGSWFDGLVNAGVFAVATSYREHGPSSKNRCTSITPITGALSKIRILSSKTSSEHYVEMYFASEIQGISLTVIGSCELVRFAEVAEIPEGYTAQEFSLTTGEEILGGGKLLYICALRERRAA